MISIGTPRESEDTKQALQMYSIPRFPKVDIAARLAKDMVIASEDFHCYVSPVL